MSDNNWISVKDVPPEIGKLYWCYNPELVVPYTVEMFVPYSDADTTGVFSKGNMQINFGVTHYQLVNPPKQIQ